MNRKQNGQKFKKKKKRKYSFLFHFLKILSNPKVQKLLNFFSNFLGYVRTSQDILMTFSERNESVLARRSIPLALGDDFVVLVLVLEAGEVGRREDELGGETLITMKR